MLCELTRVVKTNPLITEKIDISAPHITMIEQTDTYYKIHAGAYEFSVLESYQEIIAITGLEVLKLKPKLKLVK